MSDLLSDIANPRDIQQCLEQQMKNWYPSRGNSKAALLLEQEKEFRWSRHLIFRIIDSHLPQAQQIMVKCLKLQDSLGRVQHEIRAAQDAQQLEFEALSLLYNRFGKSQVDGVTAVRPLTHFPDLNALAMEYLPGSHLRDLICHAARPLARQGQVAVAVEAARKAGRLLRNIHRIKQGDYPRKEVFTMEYFTVRLQEILDILLRQVSSKKTRNRLLCMLENLHKMPPITYKDLAVSYLHGDIYPDNFILLPNGRVYTIDTTLHQTGLAEEDIAKFLIGVETLKQHIVGGNILIRPSFIHSFTQAFCNGYGSHGQYLSVMLILKLTALLHRWSELLSILQHKMTPAVTSAFQMFRVNPFMLARVDEIRRQLKGNLLPS